MNKQQKIRLSSKAGEKLQPKPVPDQSQEAAQDLPQNPEALPSTAQRVQQIQDTLASSIKAEFAIVTDRLNTSQNNPKKC